MPAHKAWREYNKKEIQKIIDTKCSKCPYAGTVGASSGTPKIICDYLSITKKMRGCYPEDCTHYLDKDVYKPKPNKILPGIKKLSVSELPTENKPGDTEKHSGGRPQKEDSRSNYLRVRISNEEQRKVEFLAETTNMTIPDFIRGVIEAYYDHFTNNIKEEQS